MIRQNILLVSVLCTIVSFPACATGNRDIPRSADVLLPALPVFTAAEAVRQGEVLAAQIEHGGSKTEWTVSLVRPPDLVITSTRAVRDPETKGRLVSLIPLSTTLEPGTYLIQARGISVMEPETELPLLTTMAVIEQRTFRSETIHLDAGNTAIRTDTSPRRAVQVERFNTVLQTRADDAPFYTGPFVLPLDSTRRTSLFGDRRVFRYSNGRSDSTVHWGVDFGVPVGTPVRSSGQGRVVMAENRITTGWTLIIEHLSGVYSLYYHLDSIAVSEGDMIKTGQTVARSGNTGLSTGPHLHWEFRVNGQAVCPDWFTASPDVDAILVIR